jgi:protein-S-isoprenylcysteine O-methyltransferase Ste14
MAPETSAVVALVVCLAGLVVVSVVRVVVHARRTGSVAIHLGAGRPGVWVGALCLAGFALALLAPGLVLTGTVAPVAVPPLTPWLGLGLMLAGFTTVVLSQSSMGASWRIGVDHRRRTDLVTGGIFAVVRNPIYSGMIAAFAGLAVMVPTFVAVAGVVLLAAAVEVQVRAIEEPHLIEAHGTAYRTYAEHTGRFVPGLGRLRTPPSGQSP